jgi:hypothetical protein
VGQEQEEVKVEVEVTEEQKRKKGSGERVGAALTSLVGSLEAALTGRGNVVTVRVNDAALERLDMLVDSGICKSRSEAAAFLLQRGIESSGALFDRIASVTNRIQELREGLLSSVQEPEE